MLRTSLLIAALLHCPVIWAQESGVFVSNLKSLRIEANGQWDADPVILLARGQKIRITFDDLQHSYVRYTYHITHCNADWQPSELLESEYMDGFNDRPIEQYETSMSTAMLYNHYTLTLPNEEVRRLLVSGNYRIDIYGENQEEPVARACFSITEDKVGIGAEISANTDVDTYASHQQVNLSINYRSYAVSHPEQELRPVVLQNHRWDTCRSGLRPTYLRGQTLDYSHNRNLIFPAGNEYRRFEIVDEEVPTMRVDRVSFDNTYYHADIMTDEPRLNYIYDQDQDGRYYVRAKDEDDECEYIYTHFRLNMPQIPGGNVYINGDLTNGRLADEYKMEYDLLDHAYKIMLPLKQGSYNYLYLYVRDGEQHGSTAQIEGDFYQTENEYNIYVYHRPFGERYDRLIGYKSLTFTGQK